MIRSEKLEWFLLGYALEIPGNEFGRATTIGQISLDAKKIYQDCELGELLHALYNLQANYAELNKYVNSGAGGRALSFERERNTGQWKDFFTIGSFSIKLLPAGRIRFEKLSEQLQAASQQSANAADDDRKYARLALDEARKSVSEPDGRPHPMVGAVVVKNGRVLSFAHRGEAAGNHAEFIALEKKLSDEAVAGATVYTTLEPCTTRNHPKLPCVARLIERKVARVVIGMIDPDARITGRGMQALRNANIVLAFFPPELMDEVEELNREFTRSFQQQSQAAQSLANSDSKVGAILSYKGKAVTVMNRQRYGPNVYESFWPNEIVVADCTSLWVKLEDRVTKTMQSFPLNRVDVTFDDGRKRLRLEIER